MTKVMNFLFIMKFFFFNEIMAKLKETINYIRKLVYTGKEKFSCKVISSFCLFKKANTQ